MNVEDTLVQESNIILHGKWRMAQLPTGKHTPINVKLCGFNINFSVDC